MEEVKDQNPSFSKLLDVLENGKLEDGHLKTTVDDLTQVVHQCMHVLLNGCPCISLVH